MQGEYASSFLFIYFRIMLTLVFSLHILSMDWHSYGYLTPFLLFELIVLLFLTEHQNKSGKDDSKVTQWKKDTKDTKHPFAMVDMKTYWGTEVFTLMMPPRLLYHGVIATLG